MVLTPHILIGAAIGSQVNNAYLLIPLALASHYLLDIVPHVEYDIKTIAAGKINKKFFKEMAKVFFDIVAGIIIVFSLSRGSASLKYVITGAFFGMLPDFIQLLAFFIEKNKILRKYRKFHLQLHFLREVSIPGSLKIFTQLLIMILAAIFI